MSRTVPPENPRTTDVARRTGLALPLLAVAGFFAVLMLAAAVQGHPIFRTADDAEPLPTTTPVPEPAPTTSGLPEFEPPQDSIVLTILTAVVAIVIGAVILLVLFFGLRLLVRTLMSLWHGRRLRRRGGADVAVGAVAAEPAPTDAPDAVEIRRGIAEARVAIERDDIPADAIVAAWIGLEESAADAGVIRGASETAAEFTVRILARRASITREVARLLRLYEDVRFGGLVTTEHDREVAAQCLRSIEEGWR
ncbi:DUF4129 domain-containing protein [Microbacterium sp. GCS4]|uniref:DUF4129 domain-containing protein n=1 Tax=Microbacterium sp. GCS4 TaxID=1692239 RepID=UPI00068118E5|nr:DUF4129 domain-containing protein [Microbacterium sp. GCS4]KNY04420.1 hypothetical protein AKH00_16150 [Microbacterium sp. GCS4]